MPLFSSMSMCLSVFSTNTTPTSTMIPMAIAIPDSATILACIPAYRMMIKVAKTPTGKILEITTEALRFKTKTITTMMAISVSCVSEVSSVPIVS